MIAQSIQFNRRSVLSLLLAVVMLTLATTPALAWFDEGDLNGQAAQPCRLISNGQEVPTVTCFQATPHHARPVAEQPLVQPSIAQAEQGPFFDQFATELLVQSTSDQ